LSRFGEGLTEIGGSDEEDVHPACGIAAALTGRIERLL
jgi:hypothetical protein